MWFSNYLYHTNFKRTMPYSHHSHSGTYTLHGHDNLNDIIDLVKSKQFRIFCLTEHCPRLNASNLYPEESEITPTDLFNKFEEYLVHGRKLQAEINSNEKIRTKLLVGFESECGIDLEHLNKCIYWRSKYNIEIVVGSVHHVNGIPIDFDRTEWIRAREQYGGIRNLYFEYFKLIDRMVNVLKPEVIAHFDLIRLCSGDEENNIDLEADWPDVWSLIVNIVGRIVELGLVVELNSSAIRKGWDTSYPKRDIMKEMLKQGVKFCLSDDSHGLDQVGLNYDKLLKYVLSWETLKLIWYYDLENGIVVLKNVSVDELKKDIFWKLNYPNESI